MLLHDHLTKVPTVHTGFGETAYASHAVRTTEISFEVTTNMYHQEISRTSKNASSKNHGFDSFFDISWLICLHIPLPEMFAWSIPQVPFAFMCFYHIAGAGISWVVPHRHRRIYSHEVGASFGATAADAVGNSRLTSWAHCYPNDPFQHGMLSAWKKFEQSGVSQQELNGIYMNLYIYMIPMVLAHDWPARAMCGAGGAMINSHLHTRKSNVYNYYKCIVAI